MFWESQLSLKLSVKLWFIFIFIRKMLMLYFRNASFCCIWFMLLNVECDLTQNYKFSNCYVIMTTLNISLSNWCLDVYFACKIFFNLFLIHCPTVNIWTIIILFFHGDKALCQAALKINCKTIIVLLWIFTNTTKINDNIKSLLKRSL